MKPLPLLLAVLAVGFAAVPVPAEDAAHRADRREVQRLNRRARHVTDRAASPTAAAADRRAYARAQADYQERLEDWRRRVEACEAGQYDACR